MSETFRGNYPIERRAGEFERVRGPDNAGDLLHDVYGRSSVGPHAL